MERLIYFFYIFFQGILFFQVAVFVYIYYSSGKKELLYYCLFLLFIAVNFLISDPSTFGIGDNDEVLNSQWYKLLNTPLVITANIFYVLFLKGFYQTLTSNRLFFKILNTVKVTLICMLVLFLLLFAFGRHSNLFFNIINFAGTVVGIWLVAIIIKEKMPYTRFMALGFILNLCGTLLSVVMLILLTQGVQHLLVSEYPFVFIKIGLLAELFFFNVAILKKWNAQERTLIQKDFEKILAVEKVRNEISKELHDDIGSTLSGIHMYSHMASEAANEKLPPKYNRSVDAIKKASGEMIRTLKDMVWTIQPGNFLLSELGEKIQEHALFMAGAKNIKVVYRAALAEDNLLQTEKRHHIFMIAKEMISNAVKYSDATVISIDLRSEKETLYLTVKDNGIGFDVNKTVKGNGLNNMQQRAAELESELIITAAENKGTSIQLISKITR